ncbi:MAG TPA: hypothetical protein VHR41_07390 [Gemmatimonadales bacterium]|nr:hypothetical protein [Gemmatimonadales bacterium]
MPFRLTSSLGVQGNSFLQAHHWELSADYRWLHTRDGDFFVGASRTPPPPALQPPGGQGIRIDVHSIVLGLTYAVTDRFRVSLAAPIQTGRVSFIEGDGLRHPERVTDLGDVTLTGSAWLINPRSGSTGNVMLGLGLKMPTGSHRDSVEFFTPTGPALRVADPAIQPGDGGWGIIMQLQAFQQVVPGALAYLSASYLLNPRVQTEATIGRPIGLPGDPAAGTPYNLSVPDAYTVRTGLSYAVAPSLGLSASLGGRLDGVPVQDLIDGGDANFRRPGYSIFVDPGLELSRGANTFSLNVPVRAHGDRRANLYDRIVNVQGGGNLAKWQVLAGYAHRF